MANKFQQSVLERLEEEAKRQKTKRPPVAAQDRLEEAVGAPVEEEIAIITDTDTDAPSAPVSAADISTYLRPVTLRVAKNKTFYLDTDVIEAIKRNSKAQKVTDSKLVCDILRQVLKV